MIARATVEAAVNDLFARNHRVPPDKMRQRLEQAEGYGWIDRVALNYAWTVWQRGNKVIHDDAHSVRDIWGTVQSAMRAVNAIVGNGRVEPGGLAV